MAIKAAALLTGLIITGCSAPAPAPFVTRPASLPRSSATGVEGPSVPSGAAASADPVLTRPPNRPPPLPSAPGKADMDGPAPIVPLTTSRFFSKRDLEVLNTGCQLVEGEKRAGCQCCPQSEMGACSESDEPISTIEHVYYGSFSAAGADEAYATGFSFQCGNLVGWGSSWFFRRSDKQWSLISETTRGHHLVEATVWRRADGRDLLVGRDVIGKRQREVISSNLVDARGKVTRDRLLGLAAGMMCSLETPGYYYSRTNYKGTTAADVNRDGRKDLVVKIGVRRAFLSQSVVDKCRANDAFDPITIAKEQVFAIPFVFDGSRFSASGSQLKGYIRATSIVDRRGKGIQY